MTTDTPGAIIFYSTTSSSMNLETDWVASDNGVDFSCFKGTIYARTYLYGKWSDVVSITLPERKLPQPTFAVKGVFGGREVTPVVDSNIKVPSFQVRGVIGGRTVTFNTTQKGAVIYYSSSSSRRIRR